MAVDCRDRVYVFSRGTHPLMIFEKNGTFITSWGESLSRLPHGIYIWPDDRVYLGDTQSHVVQNVTPDGELLHTSGKKDQAQVTCDGHPFNMPTGLLYP